MPSATVKVVSLNALTSRGNYPGGWYLCGGLVLDGKATNLPQWTVLDVPLVIHTGKKHYERWKKTAGGGISLGDGSECLPWVFIELFTYCTVPTIIVPRYVLGMEFHGGILITPVGRPLEFAEGILSKNVAVAASKQPGL